MARRWDFSLGRWAWAVATKLRGGVATPGLVAPLTLLGFSAGAVLCADTVGIKKRVAQVFCALAIVCSPMVACSLTYYPYADVYSWAFLLSALAVWVNGRPSVPSAARVALGALSTALAVGFYQTTIGVSLSLLLSVLIVGILRSGPDESAAPAARSFARGLLSVVAGCVLYLIVMKASQAALGIEMADYRGASQVSISAAIAALPSSVPAAYSHFAETLFGHGVYGNRYLAVWVSAALVLCLALSVAAVAVRKKLPPARVALLAGALLLLPLAAMAVFVIVPGSGSPMPLMVGGAMALVPLPAAAAYAAGGGVSRGDGSPVRRAAALLSPLAIGLALCLAWSYSLQVNFDSAVQHRIDAQASSLAQRIVADLEKNSDYLSGAEVMVAGSPNDGSYPLPFGSGQASPYVRWGLFWRTWDGSTECWRELVRLRTGVALSVPSTDRCRAIGATDRFGEMPVYPAEGSVGTVDGVVVVKVAEADSLS